MTIYTLNDEGRRQVRAFVESNGTARTVENLDTDTGGLDAWCDDVEASVYNRTCTEPEGHIEIKGRHSKTGNPVTATFGPECFDAEEVEE